MKIFVGMIYQPRGFHLHYQVITSIEKNGKDFIKAPVWKSKGILYVGLHGGGDISEINRVIGTTMSPIDIQHGVENFQKRAKKERE